MVKVHVKHNQNVYKDVDVDVTQPVVVFKGQLWTLTGVPIDRQKVMIKGMLQDDADLSTMGLKDGQRVMLIGTLEETTETNQVQTSSPFLKQMQELSKAEEEEEIGSDFMGLKNLGNTCFVNSVLQFLRPNKNIVENVTKSNQSYFDYNTHYNLFQELQRYFSAYKGGSNPNMYALMDRFSEAFPELFVVANPRDDIASKHKDLYALLKKEAEGFMQQDAEQFLTVFLNYLKKYLPESAVDPWFGIRTKVEFHPLEDDLPETKDEPKYESFYTLPCHLGNAQSNKVYTLQDGIKLSMEDNITKFSEKLQRNAKYQKKSRICALPEFLIIHFVRFEWKVLEATLNTPSKGNKTKICRRVSFPNQLDVYDFCTEDLQLELNKGRKIAAHRKDKEVYSGRQGNNNDGKSTTDATQKDKTNTPPPPPTGITLMDGKYQLCSVVTHQGRTADTGHYIAWVNLDRDEKWMKCDDDILTVHPWSTIDLAGGRSDYHIAYMCMYKKIPIEITPEEKVRFSL